MIEFQNLPKEIQDKIELREQIDQTFHRFMEEDYTDIFFNTVSERANPEVEHSLILSITGEQGCLLSSDKISTNNGLKCIDSMIPSDKVWAGGDWRKCKLINKGVQKCLAVKTKGGITINMTPDHRIMTEDGWRRADALRTGDYLVAGDIPWSDEWNEDSIVAAGVPIGKKSGIVEIPDWIQKSDAAMNGFFAAYFASCDGSYHNNSIEISSCSKKLIEQMTYWLMSRGVVPKISERIDKRSKNFNNIYRMCVCGEALDEWIKRVPNLSILKVVKKTKYTDEQIAGWLVEKNEGKSYQFFSTKYGVAFSVLWKAMNPSKERGTKKRHKNWYCRNKLEIVSIDSGVTGNVYDLQVDDVHEYIVNGLLSHNSGKSMAALTIALVLNKGFSESDIYFDYNQLVYNRDKLRPNSVVLVDEQQQSYGLDSHRVMTILSSLKEQLRKKSIHFIFCSPTLYSEAKSSMYILEIIFIDYETQEAYAALKTRDELTLGHVRIPYILKDLGGGFTLGSQELLDFYESKKDSHLDKILGNKDVDIFEQRAQAVMKHKMFKKAERIYVKKRGYIPQTTLIQIINKIYPEFHAGVVPIEIAGRIKLDKELSGVWDIAGMTKKQTVSKKARRGRKS